MKLHRRPLSRYATYAVFWETSVPVRHFCEWSCFDSTRSRKFYFLSPQTVILIPNIQNKYPHKIPEEAIHIGFLICLSSLVGVRFMPRGGIATPSNFECTEKKGRPFVFLQGRPFVFTRTSFFLLAPWRLPPCPLKWDAPKRTRGRPQFALCRRWRWKKGHKMMLSRYSVI